jgi:alkylation response protein AidB-like acyl-CoA dehydrogenase
MQLFGFDLTEEETMVADAARDAAARLLAPGAAERDRTGEFPATELKALAELGFNAMKVSPAHGGIGASNVGYVLAMQALAQGCASTAVVLASCNMAAKIVSEHGTPAHHERFLAPYARGDLGPISFALTEPSGGSDVLAMRTRAVRDGDAWVLTGEKAWITGASHAGLHVVFARTGDGKDGITCFLVERGARGLTVGRDEDKMGQRASGTATLAFDGCRVSTDRIVGALGEGHRIALSGLGAGRVGIAALSLGIAEAAFALGVAYAKERHVFGQPVAAFQNSQFVLADSRTELDAAWLLVLRAARALDGGARASSETSMAKLFATETCGRVVDRVVQLHGGYGYSREFAIERLYRDARVTRIYEGTSEIQRIVIARELLRG